MTSKKQIPNPNKLSVLESNFLEETEKVVKPAEKEKPRYKGRMISMSDEFYEELNSFLKKNPTEGNRSSFIVRVVANYIKDNQED